ncbi:unnamed protein product [Prorocentrum cordatum]|uniref:peptidylprolyl isomerase n=1 Tax=Prorocentrum cordatum TaxID=2364126 RepID=A0ABN9S5T4_9DINO|nr:unnamed protein product [Polarella glacialis]
MSDDDLMSPPGGPAEDDSDYGDLPQDTGLPGGSELPDGIQKEIINEADPDDWKRPKSGDEVTVHYVGKLASDGSVFDSSRDRQTPFVFTLGKGDVIAGWDKGVATMKKGELATFTISPEFAYGATGQPPKIPEDATLIFEIELLSFVAKDDLFGDGCVIKTVLAEGTGWTKPKLDDEVFIDVRATAAAGGPAKDWAGLEYRLGSSALGPLGRACDAALKGMKKGEEALLRCTKDYSCEDWSDGVEVTIKLQEIFETRDISFRKDGAVLKKRTREGEGHATPTEASKVTLSVEDARQADALVPGFASQVLEFTLGSGEVCDALECAAAHMKRLERATLTVARPALAAEARLGLRDVGAGGESIVLKLEMKEFENGKEQWNMSDEEKLKFCDERKALGNSLFKAGRLDLALGRYKKVGDVLSYIDNFPEDARAKARELKQACELNMAMCYLRRNDYDEAKAACNKVLNDDRGNVKALYRRAQCEHALRNFEECIRDCKRVAEGDPQNREVRALLKQAMEGQKEVNRQAKGMYANMMSGLGKSAGA